MIKSGHSSHAGCQSKKSGQSLVEFALVLPVFLLMMFGMVDFARYYMMEQSMSHILRKTARFASTGKTLEDPDNPGTQLSRRESIIEFAKQNSSIITFTIAPTNPEEDDSADNFKMNPYDGGNGGDFLTLTLEQDFSFITPFITDYFFDGTIEAEIRVVNERFNALGG